MGEAERRVPTASAGGEASSSVDRAADPALWEFVRLGAYQVPSRPARSAAASAWSSFKHIFRRVDEESQAPVKQETELCALPQVRLAHLVPPLDWTDAAAALGTSLKDWMSSSEPDWPVKFVIGQPYGGHGEIVRQWGAQHAAAVVAAPSYEQILAGDKRYFESWPTADRPWVLPNLERCYLRHARGLPLVRELLEEAESGRLGRGVIGCDSWAWAYLQRVWPVPRPDALTLQAFDGSRVTRLLTTMVASRSRQLIRFRNAATGHDILTVPAGDDEVRVEIAQLAAHCRGNVGTAIRYWRERLRSEPHAQETDSDLDGKTPEHIEPGEESVWVAALPEPAFPLESDEEIAFVLHALLLHCGLPASLLPELLPLSHHRCMPILLRLKTAGLVQCRNDHWRVSELAYALVRTMLQGRDFLTDNF